MKHILLVDPDREATWIIKLLLQWEGFKVDCASGPREALYNINMKRPDLIIVDNQLNNDNGRAFCEYLGKNPNTQYIPIILKEYKSDTVHPEIYICQSVQILHKQFDAQELIFFIRTTFAVE